MPIAPTPTAPAKTAAAPVTDQALAAKAAAALGDTPPAAPAPTTADLMAQIAALTDLVGKLANAQQAISANHVVLPPVPAGLIRVIAIRRGTYPNLDAKGNPCTRAFIRNEGDVFVIRAKDIAPEPRNDHPDDAPHGWMRVYDQAIAYAPAAIAPPTPVAQMIPDPLASVPIDPNAKTIPGGPGGFITR